MVIGVSPEPHWPFRKSGYDPGSKQSWKDFLCGRWIKQSTSFAYSGTTVSAIWTAFCRDIRSGLGQLPSCSRGNDCGDFRFVGPKLRGKCTTKVKDLEETPRGKTFYQLRDGGLLSHSRDECPIPRCALTYEWAGLTWRSVWTSRSHHNKNHVGQDSLQPIRSK